MKLLENKVALVTGASKGIGRAIAQRFIEEGAKVAFTYLSSVERGEALEKELAALGGEAKGFRSDASSGEQAEQLINDVVAHFGQIDIIVNNAGITRDTLMLRMSEEDFDQVISTNLKSVFNMVKACQRVFLKKRSGSIINISSIVGVKGNAGQSNYAASKAGIIGFSKSIALELGSRNIRSNVVAPGFIQTEMTDQLSEEIVNTWIEGIPLKRGGKTIDVANLCLFLSSDLSSFITGQVINVDGGMLT
mgnify:CR=1 FL=1